MKLIRVFFWICIFPFVGYSTNSSEQAEYYRQIADSLYKNAEYEKSALFYERYAYESDNNSDISDALLLKAASYWQLKDYEEAERDLNRISMLNLDEESIYKVQLARATNDYLLKNFNEAKAELTSMEYFTGQDSLYKQSLYLQVLVYNELHEWNTAHEKALLWVEQQAISTEEKTELKESLRELYSEKSIPKIKDPVRAENLAFVPGLGYLYTGYFWEGAANVGLQLIGLGLLGVGIYTTYYVAGVVIGFNLYQRFYLGGHRRTAFLAKKRNYLSMKEFREKTSVILFE